MNDRSNILFEYRPTRSGDYAARFLGGYSGFLVCDGFDGYNKLKNVTRCGCWAHVRRKFVDALPNDKELLKTSQAAVGVEYCNRLFKHEREFAALPPEKQQKERQAQSKPVLAGFFAWLDKLRPSGGTKLSKAAGYAKAERRYLYAFLQSPDIPVDNNRAEGGYESSMPYTRYETILNRSYQEMADSDDYAIVTMRVEHPKTKALQRAFQTCVHLNSGHFA